MQFLNLSERNYPFDETMARIADLRAVGRFFPKTRGAIKDLLIGRTER